MSHLACLESVSALMCGVPCLSWSPVRLLAALACRCVVLSDGMRRMAAVGRYRVPVLLAYRFVSPRSSTRGTGREAERMMMSGSEMRWEMLGSVSCVVIRMR